jgi:hypothetical protein
VHFYSSGREFEAHLKCGSVRVVMILLKHNLIGLKTYKVVFKRGQAKAVFGSFPEMDLIGFKDL